MKLTSDEIAILKDALNNAFIDRQALDTFAGVNLGKTLDVLVPNLNIPQSVDRIVSEAIIGGWMWTLIDEAATHTKDVMLVSIRDSIKAEFDSDTNRFNPLLLGPDECLVGRRDLPQILENLNNGSSKILVIRGKRKTGKSHTHTVIQRAQRFSNYRQDLCDLAFRSAYVEVDAFEIGNWIRLVLNLPDIPAIENETKAKWAVRYVDWLIGQLKQRNDATWLIFDGFGEVPITEDMKALFMLLANALQKGSIECLRLVLVDFREDLAWLKPLQDEARTIERDDLVDFFVRAQSRAQKAENKAACETLADDLMSRAPKGRTRQCYLGRTAAAIAVGLQGVV